MFKCSFVIFELFTIYFDEKSSMQITSSFLSFMLIPF